MGEKISDADMFCTATNKDLISLLIDKNWAIESVHIDRNEHQIRMSKGTKQASISIDHQYKFSVLHVDLWDRETGLHTIEDVAGFLKNEGVLDD